MGIFVVNMQLWGSCGPGMPGPYGVAESKVGGVDEVGRDIFNIAVLALWKVLAIYSLL